MSAARRGATGLSGVLLIDKPSGMTSHDVVAAVRRSTGEGRVGHAGTLDPMATGLLVVLVGPATRLEPYLSAASKSYEAVFAFGNATDTDDAEGEIVETAPVPASVCDSDAAQRTLDGFLGESQQVPPRYSAIKTGGRAAHRVMRAGGDVTPEARPVRVDQARLLEIDPAGPSWRIAFTVSKGTYIRALARDAGHTAGTCAHLSALVRTRSGPLELADASTLDEVVARAAAGELERLWTDPVRALGLPCLEAPPQTVADGRAVPSSEAGALGEGELLSMVGGEPSRLLALYRKVGDRLVPVVVLPAGVPRGPE